jgi:hypothetical protein
MTMDGPDLTTQILLTVATLGYSLIPSIADFNKTHATNPLWTGHARYHVVWQVSSYIILGLGVLYLIWAPSEDYVFRMKLAGCCGIAVYGGFFTALFTLRMYDGRIADVNGVPMVKITDKIVWDLNIIVFTIMTIFLGIAEYRMFS